MNKVELLAPAKNLETAITAINSGADAIYIGASHFGARVNAGNSLEDIKKLAQSMSVSEIAKVYMVSDDRISKFLKRNGITCKK